MLRRSALSLPIIIPTFLGSHALYEWADADIRAKDHLLHHKEPYLNAPFFIARFDILWDYYVDNHLSARENEARGFDDPGFARHLQWYWRALIRNHLGYPAIALMAMTLVLTVSRSSWPSLRRGWALACVGVGFLSPLVVLSMVEGGLSDVNRQAAVGALRRRTPRHRRRPTWVGTM